MNFIEIWGTSGCLPLLFICEKYSDARLSQNTSRALVELMFLDTKTLLWGQEYKQQFFFRCSKLFKYAHIFKWLYLRIQCLFPVNFFYGIFVTINSYNVKDITCLNNDICVCYTILSIGLFTVRTSSAVKLVLKSFEYDTNIK